MPRPMENTRAGGNRQAENESSSAADPLLQDIAKMKKLQADIEAKALLEKRKREDEKKRQSSQNLAAQLAEYRRVQRFLDDASVPRSASRVPQPASSGQQSASSLQQPTTSSPRPASAGQHPPTSLQQPSTFLSRPASAGQRLASFLQQPATSSPRLASSLPQPASATPQRAPTTPIFRNRSPVREDHHTSPLLRLPLLSPLRVPREFLPTGPPVTPPRVRTPDLLDGLRDSILHTRLFVSDESGSDDSGDDMTENNGTSDNNGNSSDLSDTPQRPKKRARQKSSVKKTNTKKEKPSGPEYFVETKLFTCKFCNQVFTSKRGFNIHKTRIHNEIISTEVACGSADRQKGTDRKANTNQRKRKEPKKTNANQPKVEVNITVNNTANYNLLGRPRF